MSGTSTVLQHKELGSVVITLGTEKKTNFPSSMLNLKRATSSGSQKTWTKNVSNFFLLRSDQENFVKIDPFAANRLIPLLQICIFAENTFSTNICTFIEMRYLYCKQIPSNNI